MFDDADQHKNTFKTIVITQTFYFQCGDEGMSNLQEGLGQAVFGSMRNLTRANYTLWHGA